MAYRVELTPRAERDLEALYRQIDADSSVESSVWYNRLGAAISGLGVSPRRCSVTPENDRLRHLLFGSGRNIYRVIFSIDDANERVVVLHIRHGARRPIRRNEFERGS